jgi:hypothetical protein
MPVSWIGPAIQAGGSILGGLLGSSASNNAANTQANATQQASQAQADAANRATDLQREMFLQQQKNNQPFYEQGLAGMNRLSTLLGTQGGEGSGSLMKDFGASDFQADPGYAWRMQQGQQALDRQGSAHGNLLSGGALKDAMDYNQGQASQEYGNAFNRFQAQRGTKLNALQSLAGVGQSATNQANQAAQNFGNQAGNSMVGLGNSMASNLMGAGNARASGYVGGANALSGGISNAVNGYNQNQLMSKLFSNQTPQPVSYPQGMTRYD